MNFKDRQGREVVIGSRVAYNLSGEVATGVVERIKDGKLNERSNWPTWDIRPIIYVRADRAWQNLASTGGVSKVTINDRDLATKVVVLDA